MRVLHTIILLSLASLLLLGCIVTVPQPTPTPMPTAAPPAAATETPTTEPAPTAEPTQQATASPPPTPTAALDLSTERYRPAMREGYAGVLSDLDGLTRYQIELEVDLDRDVPLLTGTQRIHYTNRETEPLTEIILRLLPNTPGYGGSMTVEALTLEGAPVTPNLSLGDSALTVPLPRPLAPGQSVELALTYQATLPTDGSVGYAQYGYIAEVLALPNAYALIPVYDDEGWNVELAPSYGDATFSDVALYEVQVTLPSDLLLATTGTTVETVDNGDGTTTHTSVSGPMRDFCLIGSALYEVQSADVDGVRVHSYYLQDEQSGQRTLEDAVAALRFYERLIGAYPFAELDLLATPTTVAGIEYPGLIVAAASLYPAQSDFLEWVIAHEVAHQWWYAMVGNDQLDEPWLDEALTQYTGLLYEEERYGPQAAQRALDVRFEGPYQSLLTSGQDMPAGLPVAAYSEALYGPVVYGKGPLFFHALREQVGDAAFFEILRDYYDRYSYQVAYPQDFVAIAEQVSGQELDALYQEWILSE